MAADPAFSNSTYAGEYFAERFGPAVIDPAGLIDNQLATPIDRSKYKETVNEFDDTVVLQTPSASFSDQSTTGDIDEVNLELIPWEFHKQLEWSTIYQTWMNQLLPPGSINDYQPAQINDQFLSEVYVPKLKQAQANLVLRGKNALDASIGSYTFSASYSGLYPLLNAASSVRTNSLAQWAEVIGSVTKGTTTVLTVAGKDVTSLLFVGNTVSIRNAAGTGWDAINGDFEVLEVAFDGTDSTVTIDVDTDALTSGNYTGDSASIYYINRTNIFEVMANHLTRIPVAVRRQNPKIAIPNELEYEWQFANATKDSNINSQGYLSSYQMQMIDKQVVVLDNAPANTLGSWLPKHVFYAFDLADDASNARMTWMGDTTNEDLYRLKVRSKTAVAITTKFEAEMTYTRPPLV